MKKLMDILFTINSALYKWPYHLAFLLLWLVGLSTNVAKTWILIGLAMYFVLMVIRSLQSRKTPPPNQTETNSLQDKLEYLVGLNIAVLFGPLVPVLMLLLILESKRMGKTK